MPFHQFTIRVPESVRSALIRRCIDLGSTGASDEIDRLLVFFPESVSPSGVVDELEILDGLFRKSNTGSLSFEYSLLPDSDWNESWKENFKPIEVGQGFLIVPPWEDRETPRIKLIIDPGMAFGTGHHETTRSCLLLLEKYSGSTNKERFLDVGTGTGILAIAASKIGFNHAVGIDNDPLAIDAARMNCGLNNVLNVEVSVQSGTGPIGGYDVITANLFSTLLIQLAPEFVTRLNTSGLIIIAGMLSGQEEEVFAAMKSARMNLLDILADNKWVAAVFKKA